MIWINNYFDQPGKLTTRLVLLLALFVIPMAASAEFYRYINEDGVTVLNNTIPTTVVKNGYTILDDKGRVIEVVPRALTPEEMRQQEGELAESQSLAQAQRDRKDADENLLMLYGTPEDVERARDTKLASFEGHIKRQKDLLRRMESQKRDLEAKLANIERAGGTIDEESLDGIRVIEDKMATVDSEISGMYGELDVLRAGYAADIDRVRELLSKGLIN
jgi:hypothetical protein